MSEIADPVVKAKDEFSILGEFFRVWVFVNAVDAGNRALLELACDRLVCRQHELFDQLMRFVVLNAFQSYRMTLFIDPDFYLWKIEVERAVLESFPPQQCCELPGEM